ncbi:MAG: membrane protein insertase YidC [Candidatus Binatia bacterium]
MEQRRIFIAIALSLVIVVLYSMAIERLYPAKEQPPIPTPIGATPAASPAAAAGAPAPAEVPEKPAVPPAAAAEARPVVVDTDLFRAEFTTLGARLASLTLKRHRTTVDPNSPPLEVVLPAASGRLPLELSLRGAQQQVSDAAVVYDADQSTIQLSGADTATLTFAGQLNGATVRKRISMRGDDYLWTLEAAAENAPSGLTEMSLSWIEGVDPTQTNPAHAVFDTVAVLQAGKVHKWSYADLGTGQLLEKDIGWLAFNGRYFLASMIPQVEPTNALRAWAKGQHDTPQGHVSVEGQLLFPPGNFHTQEQVYVGPKEIDRLEAVGHGLRKTVDLGWFTVVALPLLQALRFLYKFTGNYGIAIILLTVIIKVLFYPLTKKSFESMREMQKLQPEMQKIRERLKDKPDEMNREIMELYRRHKVNPLGGCLPMLLQIPVFVGLYNALLNAVELRHAPFFGWINDLSAPDRLGDIQLPFIPEPGVPVLTLIMGLSMLVQQWMTPSPADPMQQRIMLIMPIIFTFMFVNFPSGLTLYWLVNNVLTIAQQYWIMRKQPQR